MNKNINNLLHEIEFLKAEIASLTEINTLLALAGEDQVFNKVLERAMALTRASSGSLMLKYDNKLKIVAYKGLDPKIACEARPCLGDGIAGKVAQDGRPVLLVGKVSKSLTMKNRPIKDALSVPLNINNEIIGVLNINNSLPNSNFNNNDLKLLTAFANQAAVAVKCIKSREDIDKSYLSVIQALAEAIDAKDPYTAGHSRRVSKYAESLALEIGITEDEARRISLAALLHDIGKIGIGDNILRKPFDLSSDEYDLIRAHPIMSAKILDPIPSLKDVLPIIRHHHEKYDGNGYPAGLKGKEIPIGARIMAIVDAFDAMASGRSYRKVNSLSDVIGELCEYSGAQFDPEILDVFIKKISSGGISIETAVTIGRESSPLPMSHREIKRFLDTKTKNALTAAKLVTESLLNHLEKLAGRKLRNKFYQNLIFYVSENNLAFLLHPNIAIESPETEELFDELKNYFRLTQNHLVVVVGPRLAERMLIDAVSDLDTDESRNLFIMVLKEIGIDKPEE